jgi:iron complex transport system permease protein
VGCRLTVRHLPPTALLPALLLLAAGALLLALGSGSVPLSPTEVRDALTGNGSALNHDIVMELRLPRALGAFAIGALLALAGALMQVLLGNPLADPYVLGVSGGAAVGALLALFLGLAGLPVTAAAFAGALLSILLVFALARRGGPPRLLLTGVVLAAGWGAAVSFLLSIAPERGLRPMVFWLMGDLSQPGGVAPAWGALALGLLLTLPLARDLNLLARGELQAGALGANVSGLRLHLYLVASLLTAAAVTLGGNIGFVGLVIPHLVRLVAGSDHRIVLPASALLGGTLLLAADTLARTVAAPQQLPVGVLTAFIGVPLFLILLARGTRP